TAGTGASEDISFDTPAAAGDEDFLGDLDKLEESPDTNSPAAGSTNAGDDAEHFKLEDFGEAYTLDNSDFSVEEEFNGITGLEYKDYDFSEDGADSVSGFSLDESDFQELQRILAGLPLNLKLAIETFLSDERADAKTVQKYLDTILSGATARELAHQYYKITNRKIILPSNYRKQTGIAFEQYRKSFIYQLLVQYWPKMQKTIAVILSVWTIGFSSFNWVYRPLKADSLYRQGLEYLAADEVEKAEDAFNNAWYGWPLFSSGSSENSIKDSAIVVKGWPAKNRWLDYARAFRRRKYWNRAEKFYDGYLNVHPKSTKVRVEYGKFLSGMLGKYESAILVLETIPKRIYREWNEDLIIAAGDVYLEWAEENPLKYKEARYRYALALENSRNNERAVLSMMRYFLKIQDQKEILTLLPVFNDAVPGRTSDPPRASNVFANLALFHISRDNMKEALRFMSLAEKADPSSPEPFFVKAQYFKVSGDKEEEFSNYQRTLLNLEGLEFVSREQLRMRILSLGGIGRYYADSINQFSPNTKEAAKVNVLAIDNYSKAIKLYEDARTRNLLRPSAEYGALYLDFGNLLYQSGSRSNRINYILAPRTEAFGMSEDRTRELLQVEKLYTQAEKLLDRGDGRSYLPDRVLYRRAYIRYILGKDNALIDFNRVVQHRPNDFYSRMALAAVLLENGDFEASRIHYARSIELIDREVDSLGVALNRAYETTRDELLLRYAAAWNNLGAGWAQSAKKDKNNANYASALSAFTMASEYLDQVYTSMSNLVSRGAVGMRDEEDRRVMDRVGNINYLKEKTAYPYRNRLRLLGLETIEEGEPAYFVYPDIPADLR
ncbi:MAG: hypothetical protein B0D92_08315, partial [Spirochaeta sp. LUC14_002_19_P3]